MTGPMYKDTDPYKRENYRHTKEKPKIDEMCTLKRKLEFLEIRMQRVKTKLQKLQQDPTLTTSMSMMGLRPKQLVD